MTVLNLNLILNLILIINFSFFPISDRLLLWKFSFFISMIL